MTTTQRLQQIYDKLDDGGDFTHEDYELVADHYMDEVTPDILKSQTDSLENWFFHKLDAEMQRPQSWNE